MKLLVFLGLMLVSMASFAGDKVGNGGGVWACVVSSGASQQHVSSANLVDTFEAREEFGLTTLSSRESDPWQIVQERTEFLESQWPEMIAQWQSSLSVVKSNIRYVNAELVVVDDSLFRIKPLATTCANGKWQYTQFANFTYQGQILIQKELWNSAVVTPVDKAALIWHEAIYKWLRETQGDRDSVRTRQIVGLLFSDLNISEMKTRIQKVLGSLEPEPPTPPSPHPPAPPTVPENEKMICLVENRLSGLLFSGYGINELEAKGNALAACGNSGNSFHCNREDIRCEANTSAIPNRVCIVQDELNSKSYTAKGRSETEAFGKAYTMCTDSGVSPVHCKFVQCQ